MVPSITAGYLFKVIDPSKPRSVTEVVKLCHDAGFRAIDLSVGFEEDCIKRAEEARNACEKYGIDIFQSHAPYNFYKREPLEKFTTELYRSIEVSRIMGAKNLVFHADEYHPVPGKPFDTDAAFNRVVEIFTPVIDKTISYGINAAIETVFEDHNRVGKDERSHFSGVEEELYRVLNYFTDSHVTCCWDFGHAKLTYEDDQAAAIRKMGSRISCVHVHDNYYEKDLHLLPFLGLAKWKELMEALKETGFDGPLTFEAGYGAFPDELVPEYLKLCFDSMQYLIDM